MPNSLLSGENEPLIPPATLNSLCHTNYTCSLLQFATCGYITGWCCNWVFCSPKFSFFIGISVPQSPTTVSTADSLPNRTWPGQLQRNICHISTYDCTHTQLSLNPHSATEHMFPPTHGRHKSIVCYSGSQATTRSTIYYIHTWKVKAIHCGGGRWGGLKWESINT